MNTFYVILIAVLQACLEQKQLYAWKRLLESLPCRGMRVLGTLFLPLLFPDLILGPVTRGTAEILTSQADCWHL